MCLRVLKCPNSHMQVKIQTKCCEIKQTTANRDAACPKQRHQGEDCACFPVFKSAPKAIHPEEEDIERNMKIMQIQAVQSNTEKKRKKKSVRQRGNKNCKIIKKQALRFCTYTTNFTS